MTWPVQSSQGELLGVTALHYSGAGAERPGDRELLRSASRLAADAIENEKLRQRIEFEAGHDSLTGLLSRGRFIEQLEVALGKPPAQRMLAVVCIGLDRLHEINDALGHAAGDRVLQESGHRLRQHLTADGLAARIGADQFALVLGSESDEESVLARAGSLLEALRAPCRVDGNPWFVTASIGLALFPKHGAHAEELLRDAELAMHEAQRAGRNTVQMFRVKSRARAVRRLHLENSLRHAIENGELELLYQPVVSMQGTVESFEALLTWERGVRGAVPPGAFIPIAEESGLIAEIGCWVIEQACVTGAGWRRAGCRETCLSLNVSARQFEWDNFVDTVSRALSSSGFPAKCLELELTESCVMRDLRTSAERMRQIRELGVSIAIDDFGTGYSSLSYLHKLPLDSLKIDQCFLRGIAKVDGTLPVVQSIVRLAHGMHLNVVAEGVETREELELVRLAGCDQAQGHLCGQPLRAREVEKLLARGRHALAF